MNRLAAAMTALLLWVPPAAAEDAWVYMVEGVDRDQGDFAGRLVLRPQGGGRFQAERQVQFSSGAQRLLAGQGRRADWRLQVRFEDSAGMRGAVAGAQVRSGLELRVAFSGEQDETLVTRGRQGSRAQTKGTGFRVFPTDATERPATTGPSYAYEPVRGVAFLKGEGDAHDVDVNDIAQGGLGDCYLIAGIAAVARTHPHRIRSMIETLPDGTFAVYLWQHEHLWRDRVSRRGAGIRATRVIVDDAFPTTNGTSPAYAKWGDTAVVDGQQVRELWPMILEKAWAKHMKGYEAIEGGWAPTAMTFFSGRAAIVDRETRTTSEAELAAVLREATDKGYPVTLGVPESVSELGIYGNHYYVFAGLDAQGRAKLLNPWGSSHPSRALTIKELKAHIDWVHVGEF
jgi:hypothetical protein